MSTIFTGPKIIALVNDLIPDHVKANYPKYVEFIEKIALFLEEESRSGYYLNRVAIQRDIDTVDLEFLSELQNEIGDAIPRTFAANPRIFYKKLGELYRARGTLESIESFFRLLYNDDVEIYYPTEDIFRPSDATWVEQSVDIIANPNDYTPGYSYTISGGATTTVEGNDSAGRFMKYETPIVFVNNVHDTDWTANIYVKNTAAGAFITDVEYQIVEPGTTDFTLIGAADNIEGTVFTATGPGTGTGTADECRLTYALTWDTPFTDTDVVDIYRNGSFNNAKSFVSDKKKLQDSFFYQKFSYVLKTGTDVSQWRNAYNRLIHPAGFIFFGEILILIDVLAGAPLVQPGYQTGGPPIVLFTQIDAGATYSPTYQSQTVTHICVTSASASTGQGLGSTMLMEQLKFYYHAPAAEFDDYTAEELALLDVNMDAEIVLSS